VQKAISLQRKKTALYKGEKNGANGFLIKDINVSSLTGSEYC
jgi:hypothetical protein